MSRTTRRDRRTHETLRDGVIQYGSVACRHRGPCNYCRDNRTHGNKRREPITFDREVTFYNG